MSEDPGSAKSGGDLGFISQGSLAPKFEQAAWSLDVGQVSDPVRTEFGVHLIKVLAIQDEQFPSLEQRRPEIVAKLREQAAEEKYREKIRQLDELAFETPDNLNQVSEASGLPLRHAAEVTQARGPTPFDAQSLRSAAFADDVLARGFNSRVIEVDNSAYVLHVSEHRPPVERPLADVSSEIRARLTKEAASDRAREAAAAAMARVAKGDPSAAIAAAYGIEWQVLPNASRGAPGLGREILKAAFDMPRPTDQQRSVTSTEMGNGRIAVVTVTAVRDGDYGALTETERASIRTQLSRRVGNEEFTGLFVTLRDAATIDRI